TSEGVFHEAVNMAAVFKLPVVFVCENNQYPMSLPWSKATLQDSFAVRASAYGIPGADVDGQDPVAVFEAADAAMHRARAGAGPSLIGANTYRFLGHSRGDPSSYRSKDEEALWHSRDPLPLFQVRALEQGWLTPADIAAIESETKTALDTAVSFADSSPNASDESAFEDIYALSGNTGEKAVA
ncbi:MAG TPA: thiamine pyrophosphate-dependent enzyme, partial [Anaerolineae bacterium]